MDTVPDHYFSENLVAPGIEPGPLNLLPKAEHTCKALKMPTKLITPSEELT
jgi:hypothetical protein